MKILGIDTTFNVSSAAIVEDGWRVLHNVIIKNKKFLVNQLLSFSDFQAETIGLVIRKAFVGLDVKGVSLITVSNVCSLRSTVAVGVTAANLLSQLYDIPIVGVDHIEAHIFSSWLGRELSDFKFPILVFTASGANSGFVLINSIDRYKIISSVEIGNKNFDNNPEFFGLGSMFEFLINKLGWNDRVGYGFLVSKFAKDGNATRFSFSPPPSRQVGDPNFFWVKEQILDIIGGIPRKNSKKRKKFIADICASFEYGIAEILIKDFAVLARKHKIREIHLVGGVSANSNIKNFLRKFAANLGVKFKSPIRKEWSNDNAAMVASRGYYKFIQNKKKYFKQRRINIVSDLKLEKIAVNNS